MTDNCWACTKMYWLNCKFVLDVGFACIILNFSWKSHIEKTYFYTSASLLTSFLLGSITTVKMSVIKKPQIQNDLFEASEGHFVQTTSISIFQALNVLSFRLWCSQGTPFFTVYAFLLTLQIKFQQDNKKVYFYASNEQKRTYPICF